MLATIRSWSLVPVDRCTQLVQRARTTVDRSLKESSSEIQSVVPGITHASASERENRYELQHWTASRATAWRKAQKRCSCVKPSSHRLCTAAHFPALPRQS